MLTSRSSFALLLAIVAVGAVPLAGCGSDDAPAPAAAVADTADAADAPATDMVAAVAAGEASLLDVRTREEWDAGRAEGAVLLPVEDLQAGELPTDLAKDQPLYVYCRSGNRAETAVQVLRAAGYTDVTNVGGLADWEAAGGPVTS